MEISKQEELKIAHDYLKKAEELYYKYRPQLKWVSVKMAMETLGIKSKTTLQKLRDNDEIHYPLVSEVLFYFLFLNIVKQLCTTLTPLMIF